MVQRHQHAPAFHVVLGLRVTRVALELHVVIAARVSTAGQREHHGLSFSKPVRLRQKHRRYDGQRPVKVAGGRHVNGDIGLDQLPATAGTGKVIGSRFTMRTEILS